MDSHTRPDVELCVRSLGPSVSTERRERVVQRLQTLEDEGKIHDYRITIYGDGLLPNVASARSDTGTALYHRLLLLWQWATINDGDHERFVTVREIQERRRRQSYVFAPMILLEYDRTRLHFGTPFETSNRVYKIEEHLDAVDPASRTILPARQTAESIEDPVRTGYRNTPSDHAPTESRRKVSDKA